MNNLGGSTDCSGEWTICGGNSQSYSDQSVSHVVSSKIKSRYDSRVRFQQDSDGCGIGCTWYHSVKAYYIFSTPRLDLVMFWARERTTDRCRLLRMFYFECLGANEPKWKDHEPHRQMLF